MYQVVESNNQLEYSTVIYIKLLVDDESLYKDPVINLARIPHDLL